MINNSRFKMIIVFIVLFLGNTITVRKDFDLANRCYT